MSAIPDLAVVTAVAVLLFWGCGFLVARLLVPRRWFPILPLLAPFLGFALISAVSHLLGASGYSLRPARWLFVVLAASGWALVFFDRRLRRLPRNSISLLGICFLAFLLAVLPLLALGYLTTVGATMDGISYATRSEYLQDAPLRLPDLEPGKPWLIWVHSQIQLIRVGDVYAVGVLGLLTGRRSYELLTIVASLFFALTAGSIFVWVRVGLRSRRGAALLAAVLVGISNLLLWPVYDNFLSQVIATSFVPLLLCFGVEGQRRLEWRTAALSGVLFATVASVYPVYAVYALVALLCFWAIALFLDPRRPRERVLGLTTLWWLGAFTAAVVGNGFALARAGTELGFVSTLLGPGGAANVGRGNILVFPPVIEVFGIIAHAAAAYGEGWRRVPMPLLTAVGLLYTGLVVYGWWRLGPRARVAAAALLLSSAALVVHQRWGVNLPHGYPYGWFKAISALTPQVLALVAAGIAALWRVRSWRWLAGGAAFLLLALNLKHTLWTQRYVLQDRIALDRTLIATVPATSRVQPGAWVMIDFAQGLRQLWLSYLLRDQKIHFRERALSFDLSTPGSASAFFRYALVENRLDSQRRSLSLDEPWYTPESYRRLWSNGRYGLRERRDATLANLHWGHRWSEGEPVEIVLDTDRNTLVATIGHDKTEGKLAQATPRTLQLQVYGVSPFTRLEVPGAVSPLSLTPGGWILDFDLGCVAGNRLELRHASGKALLATVRVLGVATGRSGICLEKAPLRTGAAHVEQEALGDGRMRLDAIVVQPEGSQRRTYRLGLHIIDPAQQKLFGVWSLDFPPGERVRQGSLLLDLRDRSARGEIDGHSAELVTGSFDIEAGSFEGDIVWWQLNPTEQLLIEPALWFQRVRTGSVEVTRAIPEARLKVLP